MIYIIQGGFLTANITKSQEIIANREQKVFTLEAAVSSLKDIVQDNNRRIADLNKEVDVFYLVLGLIFATVITAGYSYLILAIYCKLCVAIRDFLSERRVCNSFFPNIF